MKVFEPLRECCCKHNEQQHNMGYNGWMPGLLTRSCMVAGCTCRDFHERSKAAEARRELKTR